METSMNPPGPYNITNLLAEARNQLPHLLQERQRFLPGFAGGERLPTATRIAVHLRASRLLGCPVCAQLFPRLAAREGFSEEEVSSIQYGNTEDLPAEIQGAVAWASAVLEAEGDEPFEIPEACEGLPEGQRDHLQYVMRLERLVHATGLMFLPHSWIERAAGV